MLANYNGVMIEHKKKGLFVTTLISEPSIFFHFIQFQMIYMHLHQRYSFVLEIYGHWMEKSVLCRYYRYIFACWIFLAIFNQYPNLKMLCLSVFTNKSSPLSITLLRSVTKNTILHGWPKFRLRWKDYFMQE